MILINVYFAETNRSYDFRVDTDVPVGQLVPDMVNLIALREHLTLSRDPGVFMLCKKNSEEILAQESTLRCYALHSGDELMLL